MAAASASLTGCGSFDGAGSLLTAYKADVVQGNFVSREQVQALRPGMSRQQVREVLGTPLLTSVFHADRWDYVFTLKRQKIEPQQFKLVVFFKGDVLDRFDGDTMLSEAEFVSRLEGGRKAGAVPVLEASEESLARFPATTPAASPPPPAAGVVNYPPLEAPAR